MSSAQENSSKAMRDWSSPRPCWPKWQENCVKLEQVPEPPMKVRKDRVEETQTEGVGRVQGQATNNTNCLTRCRIGILFPNGTMTLLSREWRRMPCNGQTKPGYKPSRSAPGTSSLPTLHSSRTLRDTLTLIPSCNPSQADMTGYPMQWFADSGYGSEENYRFMVRKTVWKPMSSPTTIHMEQRLRFKTGPVQGRKLLLQWRTRLLYLPHGTEDAKDRTRYMWKQHPDMSGEKCQVQSHQMWRLSAKMPMF